MTTNDATPYITPGHPTKAGAGYDCNCGQCLAVRTATHEAWEDARQKRNEAATRIVWRAYGTTATGTGHPEDPDVAKYLAEFYRWDMEMDRLAEALDEAKAAEEPIPTRPPANGIAGMQWTD